MAVMEPGLPPLEIFISRSATYLGANDEALQVLGYSAEELVQLPFGSLSGSGHEAAAGVWRAFIEDGLPIAPSTNVRLVTRTGRRIAVRFVGSERVDDDRWVSRYRLLTGRAVETDQPFVLQSLLAQWREVERRLTAVADPDEHAELEGRLADIRTLYQIEERRRRTPSDALP